MLLDETCCRIWETTRAKIFWISNIQQLLPVYCSILPLAVPSYCNILPAMRRFAESCRISRYSDRSKFSLEGSHASFTTSATVSIVDTGTLSGSYRFATKSRIAASGCNPNWVGADDIGIATADVMQEPSICVSPC